MCLKDKPKVSVLMSVYNGEKYLRQSVESILGQSFGDFEFLIVNDASKDGSRDILEEYRKRDKRIRIIDNLKNMGLTRSLNIGLREVKGDFIARQDADDVSLPWRLEKQLRVIEANRETVLVSGGIEFIDENGRVWHRPGLRATHPLVIRWFLMFFNYIGGHSQVMFRKNAIVRLGGYPENFKYSQDYYLWVKLARMGNIHIIPEVILQYRTHTGNLSQHHKEEQERLSLEVSREALKDIGLEVDISRVKRLRTFWLGPSYGFLENPGIEVRFLFRILDIFRNKVLENGQGTVDREIKKRIYDRACSWSKFLARKGKILAFFKNINLLFYCF